MFIRTCAQVVIENMEEIRMPGTVPIMRDCCTQWECARHVIFQTTIR
jgi:hypothetical protein